MGQIKGTKAPGVAMALVVGFCASTAWAGKSEAVSLDEEPAAEASAVGTEAPSGDDTSAADSAQEKTVAEEAPAALNEEDKSSPVEKPGETYYFVGARYRGIILPKFMMQMFADGGQTIYVNGIGAEFGIRKDDFEFLPSVWYAGYGADDMPFKSKSDPDSAWELVDSSIKVLYLTADFLWSKPLNKQFAINYGAGAGFGFVFGDITRENAYFQGTAPNSNGDGLVRCNGVGTGGAGTCPDDAQATSYDEPSWSDGGSKPILFPWLVVQTGLRYKPHRNFVGRLDLGFGTSGFFFGLGADYGL